jgi:hypothetical protein
MPSDQAFRPTGSLGGHPSWPDWRPSCDRSWRPVRGRSAPGSLDYELRLIRETIAVVCRKGAAHRPGWNPPCGPARSGSKHRGEAGVVSRYRSGRDGSRHLGAALPDDRPAHSRPSRRSTRPRGQPRCIFRYSPGMLIAPSWHPLRRAPRPDAGSHPRVLVGGRSRSAGADRRLNVFTGLAVFASDNISCLRPRDRVSSCSRVPAR